MQQAQAAIEKQVTFALKKHFGMVRALNEVWTCGCNRGFLAFSGSDVGLFMTFLDVAQPVHPKHLVLPNGFEQRYRTQARDAPHLAAHVRLIGITTICGHPRQIQ